MKINIHRNRSNKDVVTSVVATNVIASLFFLLFIYTAGSKLMEYEETRLQMSKSPITTDFAGVLAWLVPSLEILISFLLVSPKTMLLALYGCFTLMLLFTGYIIAIQYFSSFIPCSCGGVTKYMTWTQHLIFNIVFVWLAAIAIYLRTNSLKT